MGAFDVKIDDCVYDLRCDDEVLMLFHTFASLCKITWNQL